ncbi:uncharacterized protein NEMAJ01_2386, partial [Nematocida major]|uniref:uncharacterized protein n=1 Tax=Nematocida major TaxID=1912982 RepID=UPI0020079CCC
MAVLHMGKEKLSLTLVRCFFNLFGIALSWAVISMGVDIVANSFKVGLSREYLYFLDGYSLSRYQSTLVMTQEMYAFELLLSLLRITTQSFITSLMQISSRVFISRYVCSLK